MPTKNWLPDFANIPVEKTDQRKRAEVRRLQARLNSGIVTATDNYNAKIEKNKEATIKSALKKENYIKIKHLWDKQDKLPLSQEIVGDIMPFYNTYKFAKKAGTNLDRAKYLFSNGYIRPGLGQISTAVGNFATGIASIYPFTSPVIKEIQNIKNGLNSIQSNYLPGPVQTYGKVKYYGPTMGKTTAANESLIDFDDVVRSDIEALAKAKGVSPKDLKIVSDPDYVLLINDEVVKWKLNPANEGKTLMISNKALSNPSKILFVYDNTPSIPSRDVFIRRLTGRGAGTEAEAADYYDALLKENPNLQLDNRFVSQIENGPVLHSVSKLTEAERLGLPKGERSQYLRGTTADPSYYSGLGLNNPNYLQKLRDFHFIRKAPNTVFVNIDNTPARLYHGTPVKGWHSWDKTKFGKSTDIGMYGEGVYTTSHKDYAKVYALNNTSNGEIAGEIKEVYGNAENPFYVYGKDISPLESSLRYEAAYLFGRQAKSQGNVPNDVWKEMLNSDAIIEEYGLKRPNFSEVVFPSNGMQIKYTSPITYDNDGRIIPLSKRDNFKINDWRYKSGGKINYLKFFK